jgi:hypothetical protein
MIAEDLEHLPCRICGRMQSEHQRTAHDVCLRCRHFRLVHVDNGECYRCIGCPKFVETACDRFEPMAGEDDVRVW